MCSRRWVSTSEVTRSPTPSRSIAAGATTDHCSVRSRTWARSTRRPATTYARPTKTLVITWPRRADDGTDSAMVHLHLSRPHVDLDDDGGGVSTRPVEGHPVPDVDAVDADLSRSDVRD